MPENAGKHCCMHSWSYWSDKTLESNMSQPNKCATRGNKRGWTRPDERE
jgi:hypothetical protein